MSDGPYCVLHYLPVSKTALFNSGDLKPADFSKFVRNTKLHSRKKIPNSDSFRIYSDQKDEIQEEINSNGKKFNRRVFWNAQIFRSGALEMVTTVSFRDNPPETKCLYQEEIVGDLWEAIDGFKECMSYFKINNPIIVAVSLLRVKGYSFCINDPPTHFYAFNSKLHPSKEEKVTLTKRIDKAQDIEKEEQQIFDELCVNFGYERCEYYDKNGKRRKN